MNAPTTVNVLDRHGGFTAETKGSKLGTCTLWRPGAVLKRGTFGTLVSERPGTYQGNTNVIEARYQLPGYRYPVLVWFDATTGARVA